MTQSTGANGFYYFQVARGAWTPGQDALVSLVNAGTPGAMVLPHAAGGLTANADVAGTTLDLLTASSSLTTAPDLAVLANVAARAAAVASPRTAAAIAGTMSTSLFANSSFTIDKPLSGLSVSIRTANSAPLTIASPILVSQGETLSLAANNIVFNAPAMVRGAGSVNLIVGSIARGLLFAEGVSLDFVNADGTPATAPVPGQNLYFHGGPLTLVHSMEAFATVQGNFALARNLVAPETPYTAAVKGSLGNATFNGLGHSISNLTINAPDADSLGLFNWTGRGIISNLRLLDVDITGRDKIGGLAGTGSAPIYAVVVTGKVMGRDLVGGVIGQFNGGVGPIVNVAVAATVTGRTMVGGITGHAQGILQDVSSNSWVSGYDQVGGILGVNRGYVYNALSNSDVVGQLNFGALVGVNSSTLTGVYDTTATLARAVGVNSPGSGKDTTFGLSTAQMQGLAPLPAALPSITGFLGGAFAGGTGGVQPYLATRFATGVQAINGLAFATNGTPMGSSAAGAPLVTLTTADGLLAQGVVTRAGSYQLLVAPGAVAGGFLTTLTLATQAATTNAAALTGGSLAKVVQSEALRADVLSAATSAPLLSLVPDVRLDAARLAGGDPGAAALVRALPTVRIAADRSFAIDQAVNATTVFVTPAGSSLTVAVPINVTNASLGLLSGGALAINAPVTLNGDGRISLGYSGAYTIADGASVSFLKADGTPSSAAIAGQSLVINSQNFRLIHDFSALPALNFASSGFALAHDLAAPANAATAAIIGRFGGIFDGLGHTLTGLTINAPTTDQVGLIGQLTLLGTVRNIDLVGGSVRGRNATGGLVGRNEGLVSQSTTDLTVVGITDVGSMVGLNAGGTIVAARAGGRVTGVTNVGGLAGSMPTILGGIVLSQASATVTGTAAVGGLVGSNGGRLTDVLATGMVSGIGAGALIGAATGQASVTRGYFDTATSGTASSAGGTGFLTSQLQGGAAALGAGLSGGTNGVYPYLIFAFPGGVQALSGTAQDSAGATAAAAAVTVFVDGRSFGAQAGANGYFYAALPFESLAKTFAAGQTLALGGGPAVGLAHSDGLKASPGTNLDLGVLHAGLNRYATTAATSSGLAATLAATFGPAPVALALPTLVSSGDFSINSTMAFTNAFTLQAAGDISIDAGGSIASTASGDAIVIARNGAFTNRAGADALSAPNGRWLVHAPTFKRETRGGLAGRSFYGASYDAATRSFSLAPGAGNRFVYGVQPTLTVDVLDQNIVYNGAAHQASVTYTGLQQGDTLAQAVQGTVTGISAGPDIGTYALQPGGLVSDLNYRFAYLGGTVRINPATLTYVSDTASRAYGDPNAVFSGTVTGFVGADTLAGATTGSANFTTLANPSSGVGAYAVTGSGLSARNYVFRQAGANVTSLVVIPRLLTLAADNAARTYGSANPAFTYTVGGAGLVNGDMLLGTLATAAGVTSGIGDYAIEQGSMAAGANYALSFAGGTLTVTPRPITIAADPTARLYMDLNPAFTWRVGGAGLVNGDALTVRLGTAALPSSTVGAYAITATSIAASPNYAVTYEGADLMVQRRPITVTARPQSRVAGAANLPLTYTVNRNLTARAVGAGAPLSGALATTATAQSPVGRYAIAQGTLTNAINPNYTITYHGADLIVTPRQSASTGMVPLTPGAWPGGQTTEADVTARTITGGK